LTQTIEKKAILRDVSKCNLDSKNEYSRHENVLNALSVELSRKLVGEEKNIKTAICAIVSKDLPKEYRTSLMIVNPSSTGKSYFINTLLEPFKSTGDVIELTIFTDAYLKRSLSNVNGKIIKLEQLESKDDNGNLALTLIKHLMSEGEINAGLVETDEHGKKTAVKLQTTGIPVVITTATSNKIDRETENRFLIMELDESDAQTEKILSYINKVHSSLNTKKEWSETVKRLESFFKEIKDAAHMTEGIVIPFLDKIKVPKNLEMRRDLKKIYNITEIIAFINWRYRDRLQNKIPEKLFTSTFGDTEDIHKGVIIAKPEDYIEALNIAGSSIKRTLNKATIKTREIYEILVKLADEQGLDDTGISLKQITEKLARYPQNTIRDHLDTLTNNGFVLKDYATREHRYYPLKKKFTDLAHSEIQFTPEEYLAWIKGVLAEDTHSFVSSTFSPITPDLCLKEPKELSKTSFDTSRQMGEIS